MAAMNVREYRPGDLRQMYALDVACFPEPFRFDLRSMKRFAEARDAIVLLAEKEQDGDALAAPLAGFVIVHLEPRRLGLKGYVVTLDVAPEQRRKGVAGVLMTRAEELAVAAGARWMELHVFTGNEGAIRFYESRGYVRLGIEPAFYGSGEGEALDAFVYRKELARAEVRS